MAARAAFTAYEHRLGGSGGSRERPWKGRATAQQPAKAEHSEDHGQQPGPNRRRNVHVVDPGMRPGLRVIQPVVERRLFVAEAEFLPQRHQFLKPGLVQ